MARGRVTLNHAGIRAILRSAEVEAALLAKGEEIKAAADAAGILVQRGNEREPMPYTVKSDPSTSRARVYVIADHPAGVAAEAKYRTLGRAVDSAR